MTIEEVLAFYGSGYKVMQALGIRRQNWTEWVKKNSIPPGKQIMLQTLTKGKLKARLEVN